jgi:hypothetical protein
VEISPSLISTVTDAVLDEVRAWQSRPLDAVYPILYLDALQGLVPRCHSNRSLPDIRIFRVFENSGYLNRSLLCFQEIWT